MSDVTTSVAVLKTLSLLMGGLITLYAYRAYDRTGSPALRALTVGFGVVTVGALAAGALDRLVAVDPSWALVVESGMTTLGFAVILYSLHTD